MGERVSESRIHRCRERLSSSTDHYDSALFEHQRIDVAGKLTELSLQLGYVAAR